MNMFDLSVKQRVKIGITLILLSTASCLYGQETTYTYFYRVYFRDKGGNNPGNYSATNLLSQRALDRRKKAGIHAPDLEDLPVEKSYLNQISQLGLKLHSTSKWMNTALFKSPTPFDIKELFSLPYVLDARIVKTPGKKNKYSDKLAFTIFQSDLFPYDKPITMINGNTMHESGFDGKNVLIAILDGGFTNADNISSLKDLRSRNGIRTTYDFVKKNKSVYNSSTHGTAVLSVIAGNLPGQIEGTAPGADFLLLKTEDIESEFPCEEDFWAAGAEFADSSGADIISSSLGYFNFDDSTLNYKRSDLDGKTAFVTRAAVIAASKGILVVNSAGNERNMNWENIIFPSDGDNVLAVGAVDGDRVISGFSSAGPSADGRIKPDNVAMGVLVPVQTSEGPVGRSSGTSFSCPVLSGMAACLMEAVPRALNSDIIQMLHTSADRYNNPDSLYGYGIPDILIALNKLQNLYVKVPEKGIVISPNPTTGSFEIIFPSPPENVTVEIISMSGELILKKYFTDYAGRTLIIKELQNKAQGIYLLRVKSGSEINVRKILKINN